MHSPPLHQASLARYPITLPEDHSKAALLRRLPPYIASHVIDLPPGSAFNDTEAQRERRLRLLIRRLVNQVQYGCLNRNCSAPTCLSYRKRNSKTAVRIYSDLSARTLACDLIQEYSKPGKDISHVLCPNQPIVPWYKDSNLTRPSDNSSEHHGLRDQSAGLSKASAPLSSPEAGADYLSRSPEPSIQDEERLQIEVKIQTLQSGDRESRHFLSDYAPTLQSGVLTPQRKVQTDNASVTQAMQCTQAMQELHTDQAFSLPGFGRTEQLSLPSVEVTTQSSAEPTMPTGRTPSVQVYPSTAFHGLTFSRLDWPALKWLSNVSQDRQASGSPFETFIRNNLQYTFGHPYRLVASSRLWSKTTDTGNLEMSDNDPMPTIGHDGMNGVLEKEQNPAKTNLADSGIAAWVDSQSALQVFNLVSQLPPGLDHVFSVLRHTVRQCYTVPESAMEDNLRKHSPKNMLVAEPLGLVLDGMLSPLIRGQQISQAVVAKSAALDRAPHQAMTFSLDDTTILESAAFGALAASFMDCISHQIALDAMRNAKSSSRRNQNCKNVLALIVDRLCNACTAMNDDSSGQTLMHAALLQIARTVVVHAWNRDPVIERTSPAGGAFEFLRQLYHHRQALSMNTGQFQALFSGESLVEEDSLTKWLSFEPNGRHMHILSFGFLFETATLVRCFRLINIVAMRRSHEFATAHYSDAKQFLHYSLIPVYGAKEVLATMRPHMARYFVLTVSRGNILEDTINQLWRRQRREVLRPLRVRLGREEGEEGLDHGGVQQEFFRLVFIEAFDASRGMFTVDDRTHMTWFQPGSLEPLYKFETLGILMSLAVYNGITLPINMPIAFYRKLLGLRVKKLEHIMDGWPDLASGLQQLLAFEGDVAEQIGRTYEFSYEFAGTTTNINMQKDTHTGLMSAAVRGGNGKDKITSFESPGQLMMTPPSQSPASSPMRTISTAPTFKGISTPLSWESDASEEAPLVNNANRQQYVKDYIVWLTDKSVRAQYTAFAHGFMTCINQAALSLFSPEQLRSMVEGHRHIDINELEEIATYDDFERTSSEMRDFWNVIRSFSPEQHRRLLEFVTASDRVPVRGIRSINFTIQKNGEDDARLPTSSTCYQRLLLPKYSSKDILAERLGKALEYAEGFGVV